MKLLFWPFATSQHGAGFVVLRTTACISIDENTKSCSKEIGNDS